MSIERDARSNFALWAAARQQAWRIIDRWFTAQGLESWPWKYDSLQQRVAPAYPSSDAAKHVAFVEALTKDYRRRFEEQFEYRLSTEANVLVAFRGIPGSAKSSCAGNVADVLQPIDPAKLTDHFAYDMTEVPTKLRQIKRGAAVILDENVRLAGEGARTAQMMLENIEDTLRKTGKCLFVCTPGEGGEGIMEAELEALAWNRTKKYTLYMFYFNGHPLGLVPISWMRDELYAAYEPWKNNNMARTESGSFRDPAYYVRMALRLFDDKRFVWYLLEGKNKPKRSAFKDAMNLFWPQMMATSQAEGLLNFTVSLVQGFSRTEKHFKENFHGLEPNDGLRTVANKWYRE